MRIAIYNGNLKPTTFVLTLARIIDEFCIVFVAGKSKRLFKFKDLNTRFLPTHNSNKIILLFQFLFRLPTFLCLHPKTCLHFISILGKSDKSIRIRISQFLIWSKLFSNKFDIVHIQWASHLSLFEELLDFSYFKIVVSLRGRLVNSAPLTNDKLIKLYQNTFPKIHLFHAVSCDIKKVAVNYGADNNRVKVIYSGINIDSFQLNTTFNNNSDTDTINILSVGREHWMKGYNYALDAVKGLKDKGLNVNYTIVGAAESEELIVSIENLGIATNVNLVSKLTHNEVLNTMKKADVFLLPSVSEGLANVVIEAMSVGLPVISSDIGGMPELVIHKETGLLFTNRNVQSLINVVLQFKTMTLTEKELMISKAYEKVTSQHSLKRFKNEFTDFYLCNECNIKTV